MKKKQNFLSRFYQIINILQAKIGNICLINSHICKIIEIVRSKPGKTGAPKCLIRGIDIFLGTQIEQIFRLYQSIPIFSIEKTSYTLLQDPNETQQIIGLKKDDFKSYIQLSLKIVLTGPQIEIISTNKDCFKILDYTKVTQLGNIKRFSFIKGVFQFFKANKIQDSQNEGQFDVITCCGYSSIICFRIKQKQIRLSDYSHKAIQFKDQLNKESLHIRNQSSQNEQIKIFQKE